jgi:hypothetical protein
MLAKICAEARGRRGVGVFFPGQMQAMKVCMGGYKKLLLCPMPVQSKKEVCPVHLVDLGDEPAKDFILQLLHDAVNDEKVHFSLGAFSIFP